MYIYFIIVNARFDTYKARYCGNYYSAFFFVCVCPFLRRISILSEAVNLLPGQLLQLNTLFKYIYLYCINGRGVGLIELVVLIYFVGNLFVIPRLYFSMRKIR